MAGDSHDGSAIHRQGEKDIELTGAIDEVLGAIERVGDPTAPDREAGGIVGALLGEEGIAWICLADALADDPVGGKIGVGHRRVVAFSPDRGGTRS